jgi:hypothetical protein
VGNPSTCVPLDRYNTALVLQNSPLDAFAHIKHIKDKWSFSALTFQLGGDLSIIKLKIPSFQGKNDPEVYLEYEKR